MTITVNPAYHIKTHNCPRCSKQHYCASHGYQDTYDYYGDGSYGDGSYGDGYGDATAGGSGGRKMLLIYYKQPEYGEDDEGGCGYNSLYTCHCSIGVIQYLYLSTHAGTL